MQAPDSRAKPIIKRYQFKGYTAEINALLLDLDQAGNFLVAGRSVALSSGGGVGLESFYLSRRRFQTDILQGTGRVGHIALAASFGLRLW